MTRRRLLAGLGAVGVGAAGAGFLRFAGSGSESALPGTTVEWPSHEAVDQSPSAPTSSHAAPTSIAESSTTNSILETTTTVIAESSVVAACRKAWRAEPVIGQMVEHTPVRLTLHHTAVSQTSVNQGPSRARQHQGYHQSLGWPDLAYHFLVDRSGLAYEGRDVRFRGDTGTEYDPTGHFLVCLEGDFDVQEPTAPQVETMVALFAWASQEYGIEASTLAGHGSYAVTSCPGSAVSAMISDLQAAISHSDPMTLDLVCGSAAAELVASVEAS